MVLLGDFHSELVHSGLAFCIQRVESELAKIEPHLDKSESLL